MKRDEASSSYVACCLMMMILCTEIHNSLSITLMNLLRSGCLNNLLPILLKLSFIASPSLTARAFSQPLFLQFKPKPVISINTFTSTFTSTSLQSSTNMDAEPTSTTSTASIPASPYRYLFDQPDFLDLADINTLLSTADANRQVGYDLSSNIKSSLLNNRAALERNNQDGTSQQEILEKLILQALALDDDEDEPKQMDAVTVADAGTEMETDANNTTTKQARGKKPRIANLSLTFGDYIRYKAYMHFLKEGTLIPQSSLNESFTDEEYLSGIITMNHDLARYAIGRATERDVASVLLARDLVSKVLDHLMEYDFRNGNLRRKYDGVKYALKTCETVLYELSVTGCDVYAVEKGDGKETKRAKIAKDDMPEEELKSLCKRMAHRDELREALIKKSRDGQKAAKQAIYALHREDFEGAERLIASCEKCVIEELNPIVDEEPQLRHGSFANVLEEYAEAKMFYAWLVGDGSSIDVSKPKGQILLPSDFIKIPLQPIEYLGGLCDLTGEVGRFAVKRGTQRDTPGVKLSLETDTSILYALQNINKLPGGGLGKKIDPLRRSVEKLERMLYELSLVKATGRNVVAAINDTESPE